MPKRKRPRIAKLNLNHADQLIQLAIEEDYGTGDVTSNLLFKKKETVSAHLVSREEIIVSGLDVAREVLKRYDSSLQLKPHIFDGEAAHIGKNIATITGPLHPMLSAERVVLNFLQRLCGIATTTSKYVWAVSGTKAKIYDTRKTLPGWRHLDKYAVRCGGGFNHRLGLHDAILIKDNHLAELGRNFQVKLRKIIEEARSLKGIKFIAVEVDHVDDQLNYVLDIDGIDIVLLDNMGQWQLKHAVEMRDAKNKRSKKKKPLLEASGNVTLSNVSAIASSGVDRIAIGAITHSAVAVDIGLDR